MPEIPSLKGPKFSLSLTFHLGIVFDLPGLLGPLQTQVENTNKIMNEDYFLYDEALECKV